MCPMCPIRARRARFVRRVVRINSRTIGQAMIESFATGLLAWRDGQPGQVGNEAATAVFHQCRGSGSSPSFRPPLFSPRFPAITPGFVIYRALCSFGTSSRLDRARVSVRFISSRFLRCSRGSSGKAAACIRMPFRFGFSSHCY